MTTDMVDRVQFKKIEVLNYHVVNKIQEFNAKCYVRQKENTPDSFF